MDTEKRKHLRFNPTDISASITIETEAHIEKQVLAGTVVDMSYSGIKIRLNQPLKEDIENMEILIALNLPESGVPVTIKGMIKHLNETTEYGFQYQDIKEQEMDQMMFECIKVSH